MATCFGSVLSLHQSSGSKSYWGLCSFFFYCPQNARHYWCDYHDHLPLLSSTLSLVFTMSSVMHFPKLSLEQHEILHSHFLYSFPSLLMLPCNLKLTLKPLDLCDAVQPLISSSFSSTVPSSPPSLFCTTLNNFSSFFEFSPSKNALIHITLSLSDL